MPPPGWPGAPPVGPTERPPVRPSGWWFVVAGIVAIAGIAVGMAVIVRGAVGLGDRVEDLDRAVMPTTLEVEITDAGGYSIYHEYDGIGSVQVRDEPDVTVTDPSGRDVVLRSYRATVTYNMRGHNGVGVYTFRADEPGTYEVQASMPFSSSGRDLIAVGPGIGSGLAVAIASGTALIGLSVIAGIVIAIVVGVTRGRRRRAAMPPPVVGWAPPGQWAPPSWPPGPAAPGSWPYPPPPPPPVPATAPPPPADAPPPDAAPADAPPGNRF